MGRLLAPSPTLTVTNQTLTQGQAANFTVTATDPSGLPLTYSINNGSALPAGLSLNPSTGQVTGTPTTSGTSSVTFRATNSRGGSTTKIVALTVNPSAGSLDTSFGMGGKILTDVELGADEATALVVQSDGKIVVVGNTSLQSTILFNLTRYNSDGTLDTSFGTDGKVGTRIYSGSQIHNSEAHALALQNDGKLVVAGSIYSRTGSDFLLVRYNSDGSLDDTFGADGKVITDFGSSYERANALVLQGDGKLVIAGSDLGIGNDFALVRYNSDGSLDTAFGTNGKVMTDFGTVGSYDDHANTLALQSDGKLVAAGAITLGDSPTNFALARYDSDGRLDTTFGAGGKVITDFGDNDGATALVIQNDGRIVAAGQTGADFALVRYNSNGVLDTSFDSDGKVITDFSSSYDIANALVVQGDGKIVVAGSSSKLSDDFGLIRYNSNGSLDTNFGTNGKIITKFDSTYAAANALMLQGDGKIVAAGAADYKFALVRYNP